MKKYILIFFALMIHSYSIYSMELEQGPATRVSFEIGTKETEIKEEATLTVAPPVENSWQDVFLKSQEEKNRIRKPLRQDICPHPHGSGQLQEDQRYARS